MSELLGLYPLLCGIAFHQDRVHRSFSAWASWGPVCQAWQASSSTLCFNHSSLYCLSATTDHSRGQKSRSKGIRQEMALRVWSKDPVISQSPENSLSPSPFDSPVPAVLKYSTLSTMQGSEGIVGKALGYWFSLNFLACAHYRESCPCMCPLSGVLSLSTALRI